MKTKSTISAPYFMLVFALIGMAIAFYDSHAIYTGRLLWCPPPIDGCNIVLQSPYGRIYGVPIGYFGLLYYVIMFAIAALLAFDPFSRGLRLGGLLYTAIGVSLSICFLFIDVTLIHAFCVYCLISAILTLLLLVSAITHFRAPGDGHRLIANEV